MPTPTVPSTALQPRTATHLPRSRFTQAAGADHPTPSRQSKRLLQGSRCQSTSVELGEAESGTESEAVEVSGVLRRQHGSHHAPPHAHPILFSKHPTKTRRVYLCSSFSSAVSRIVF